jgi:hypothetical protein
MLCLSRKFVNITTPEHLIDKPATSVIESAIVTMVSCTPAIHLFWTKHADFLRSRLGLRMLPLSQTKSKLSESNLGESSASESDRVLVHTHHYVELEERAGLGRPPYEVRASSNKQ